MKSRTDPIAAALGWFLVIASALWLLLAGGCTASALLSQLWLLVRAGQLNPGMLLLIGAFGAIGIAPGLWLLRKGLALAGFGGRRAKP